MNPSFFYKYLNITLFAILGNFQSTALSPDKLTSLYNVTDKVIILNNPDFSSTVYGSDTAWLIEFYASWCGHCRTYANTYREVAINTWGWRSVVRMGAINCYAGENNAICYQQDVRGYPTLRLMPPDAIFDNKSKAINVSPTDAIDVERQIIKGLETLNKGNRTWPHFVPVNRIILEELYVRIPKSVKLALMIVEKHDDFTGRQIMLDFSKYHNQIAIFRTTTDGKLWHRFHLNITDVPALFVLLRNRTIKRLNPKTNLTTNIDYRNLFNDAIRSYINQKKLLDNFDDEDFKEIIRSRNALINARLEEAAKLKNRGSSRLTRDKYSPLQKVSMIDLQIALSYMLRQEIPQAQDIQGQAYDALVQWLTVLTKYFPGSKQVMAYLDHVSNKVHAHSNGLSGNTFREIIDTKTSNAYLPNTTEQYQHCAGSAPHFRGYPCTLWLLFHTLTVSQYQIATSNSMAVNIIEIPLAIKGYVQYFFSCRQCSENFMNETADINRLNLTNKYEAILYLWKIHNHVNQRLRNSITEDPMHPKIQFPSRFHCTTCRLRKNYTEYDYSKTIDFLLGYYSKDNIVTSLLPSMFLKGRFPFPSKGFDIKIESIEQTGYFTGIFQRYSTYIFFVLLLILLILFRRRYCKAKIKRYTL